MKELKDYSYGTYDSLTNTWTGIVGDTLNKTIDIAIGDIDMTYRRSSIIDYLTPIDDVP